METRRWTIGRLMVGIAVLAVDFALVAPFTRNRRGGWSMVLVAAMMVGYLNVLIYAYLRAWRQARAYRQARGLVRLPLGGCLVAITLMVGLIAFLYVSMLLALLSLAG